jgi:hypothetical protein
VGLLIIGVSWLIKTESDLQTLVVCDLRVEALVHHSIGDVDVLREHLVKVTT